MALRQGAKALARSVMQSRLLPTRGGGGGPIKYCEPPNKPVGQGPLQRQLHVLGAAAYKERVFRLQVPLYDEFWWDDGQLYSQPVLDGVGEPMPYTPVSMRQSS